MDKKKLPDGWRWVQLNQVAMLDKKLVQPNTVEAINLVYLSMEHVESNTGRILKAPTEKPEDEGNSTTYRFTPNHILYGKLRPYLNKVAEPDFDGRCTTELVPLLLVGDVDRHFLTYILRRKEIVDAAMRGKTGARMPRANMDDLFKEEIPLPPLPEQKRIAAILTERLAAVEQARKASEARLEAARALPAAYLREVFESEEARKWKCLEFEEVAVLVRGKFSHRPRNDPRFYGGKVPWIQTGEVESSDKYIRHHKLTLNERGLSVSKLFPKGTLVLTIAATIGAVGILDFDSCMPDSLIAVLPKDGISETSYLYYLLLYMRENLVSLAPKMAQANLKLELLDPIKIPVPPLKVQNQISKELDQKFENIRQLASVCKNEIEAVMALPASLLRQAFSGAL